MNDLLKKDNSELEVDFYASKKEKRELDTEIKIQSEVGKNKKNLILKHIADYEQEIKQIAKEDIPKLITEYSACEEKIKQFNIQETLNLKKDCQSNMNNLIREEGVKKHEISNLKKEIKFFETNKECNQCHQEISDEYANKLIKDIQEKIDSFQKEIGEISNVLQEQEILLDKIKKLETTYKDYQNTFTQLKDKMKFYRKEIEVKKKHIEEQQNILNKESTDNKAVLESLSKSLESCLKKIKECEFIIQNYEYIFSILRDDGIKLYIIRTIIPTFNSIIKDFENLIDSDFHLEFDDNFQEKIYNINNEVVEFHSMSTGEKAQLNIILIFAFRELAKLRSGLNTNLLILDEFIEGILSDENVESFKIMVNEIKNTNIQLISHIPDYYDSIVTRKIEVKKVDHFSTITYETVS